MADELKKIDLTTVANEPSMRAKKAFPWKLIVVPLGVLVVVVIVLGVMLLPIRGVMAKAKDVISSGQAAAAAIKNQDLEKTKNELSITREHLSALEKEYNKVKPLRVVPFLGAYINDGQHAIAAGGAAIEAGQKAIEALEPNADLLGLKGKSTFVSGTADDRIQTAVKTMNALVPKVNEMAVSIDILRKEHRKDQDSRAIGGS